MRKPLKLLPLSIWIIRMPITSGITDTCDPDIFFNNSIHDPISAINYFPAIFLIYFGITRPDSGNSSRRSSFQYNACPNKAALVYRIPRDILGNWSISVNADGGQIILPICRSLFFGIFHGKFLFLLISLFPMFEIWLGHIELDNIIHRGFGVRNWSNFLPYL